MWHAVLELLLPGVCCPLHIVQVTMRRMRLSIVTGKSEESERIFLHCTKRTVDVLRRRTDYARCGGESVIFSFASSPRCVHLFSSIYYSSHALKYISKEEK